MEKKIIHNKEFIDLEHYNDLNKYISEKNIIEEMREKVEPYLNSILQSGTIKGINNVDLYYEKYIAENSKGSIVISHGFGEYIEKYNELIYYFLNERYSVYIMEHRGNGRSQRLGKNECQINVEKFEYYIEDLKKFLDVVVKSDSKNKPTFLFGHSMGGGIGTMFLEKYPNYFDKAVFSSPMYEINSGKTPKIAAILICALMNLFGKSKEYIPGQTDYTGERRFPNRTTSSENRYEHQYCKIKDNEIYQTGGASAKWYLESLIATKKLRMKKNAKKITTKVLLFQCGKDTHVIPTAHDKVAKHAKDFKIIHIRESKHEPYFETDKIAFPVLDRIFDFYNK